MSSRQEVTDIVVPPLSRQPLIKRGSPPSLWSNNNRLQLKLSDLLLSFVNNGTKCPKQKTLAPCTKQGKRRVKDTILQVITLTAKSSCKASGEVNSQQQTATSVTTCDVYPLTAVRQHPPFIVSHYDTVQWSPYSTNSKFLVEVACPVGRSSGPPKRADQKAGLLMLSRPTSVYYRERKCERESTSPSLPSLPLKQEYALSFYYWRMGQKECGRGQRSASTHLQEVILNVAIEGAAQPHSVILPRLIRLQVEAKVFPTVLKTQAKRRPHLEEHRR